MPRNIASARYPNRSSASGQVSDFTKDSEGVPNWHDPCIGEADAKPPRATPQPAGQMPGTPETGMNASNPAIASTPPAAPSASPVAAPASSLPSRRPGVLGALALLLWLAAVCLGIVAPLVGLHVDATVVVAVLVASGIASLVSLPTAAGLLGRDAERPQRPTDSPDRRP